MKTGLRLFVVFAIIIFAYTQKINAQYAVDPTFGINGIADAGFGDSGEQNGDTPYDMLIQPDGKILTAGISDGADGYFIAMARHNPNGLIDSTEFGDSGKVRIHFEVRDQANAIALQLDGKIVAVGSQASSNAGSGITPSIYRFNSDGGIDTTFGNNGFLALRYDAISSGQFYGVSVQSDGKILAVGSSTGNINGGANGFGAMRFLSDGTLDTAFGNNGKARILEPTSFNPIGSFFTEDKEVIFATLTFNGQFEYILAKMDSIGNRDSTFGNNGIVEQPVNPIDHTNTKLEVTSDGKILMGVTTINSNTNQAQFSVLRFMPVGIIDSTFGTMGRTDVELSNNDVLRDVSSDINGKILLVGASGGGFGFAGLARLNPDGSMDTTFAPGGKLISDLNNNTGTHYLTKAIPLSDGSILACGFNFGSGRGNFLLTKYVVNTTGVESNNTEPPNKFSLEQNYPNPFNPSTKIKYSIPLVETLRSASVQLIVYDILGKEVATLVNENQQPGQHEVTFNARGLASGVYFYKLSAGNYLQTKKMLLLK